MKLLILGGTGELGSALVELALKKSHQVVFSFYQNRQRARELEALGAKAFQCDLRDTVTYPAGGWDAVIYAAQVPFIRLLCVDGSRFLRAHEVDEDLKHDLRTLRQEAPYQLVTQATSILAPRGQLLFLNTLEGVKTQTVPSYYALCQASLKGLVEASAHELGPQGYLVNQLCMGVVDGAVATKMPKALREKYLKHCALGRFMKPSEVANLALGFLTHNSYTTGASIIADGAL